jgi:XRE family transcriptional regulator of biofilm formation
MNTLAKQLGKRISAVRHEKGMTSEKLAYEAGISKGYLSDVENGNKLPSLKVLAKLGDVLGVRLRRFFETL